MHNIQNRLRKFLLRIICEITSTQSKKNGESRLYRAKIMGGFIRGMYISMPQLERISYVLGTYEPHIFRFMRSIIQPGDITFDIGAHVGYFTLVMSKIVQDKGHIYSFEPNPGNFTALEKNREDNKLRNVTLFQKAVCDFTDITTFASFDYSLVGHIATPNTPNDAIFLEVQSTTLDDFVYKEGFPIPSFIKIDVEGAEDRVLFGAERLIKETKPVIIVEVREGRIYQKISSFMSKNDYSLHFFKGERQFEENHLSEIQFIPNQNIRFSKAGKQVEK